MVPESIIKVTSYPKRFMLRNAIKEFVTLSAQTQTPLYACLCTRQRLPWRAAIEKTTLLRKFLFLKNTVPGLNIMNFQQKNPGHEFSSLYIIYRIFFPFLNPLPYMPYTYC